MTDDLSSLPAYKHPLGCVWSNMMQRCHNPKNHTYPRYGGRGIKVCERWRKFENFFADMGMRPTDEHTIDRIDSNGDYEPSNCRWLHQSLQGINRRSTQFIEFLDETKPVSYWEREYKLPNRTINPRLQRGWPLYCAITFKGSPNESAAIGEFLKFGTPEFKRMFLGSPKLASPDRDEQEAA